MALGLPAVAVFVLCASLSSCVLAGEGCKAYTDSSNKYHFSQYCSYPTFCCGTCGKRKCCSDHLQWLSESTQEKCSEGGKYSSTLPVPSIVGCVIFFVLFLVFICCFVCPCCSFYKMCRKPRPVVTSTTHTTVVTTTPQHYPQQPTAEPGPSQSYQGVQYPPHQPMPVQPGYGTQGMPTTPYQGEQFIPGPPPTYQEATGPSYPPLPMPAGPSYPPQPMPAGPSYPPQPMPAGPAYPPQPMPYSQAAYGPEQPAYPLHPPAQPQPNVPPPQMDFLAQPAYNPDFFAPSKLG
ncbi:protein shisa-5 [Nematolebias whitei]|uniref:protein shisa-5 n=1 Tax=Nematolebias whitei TaxID=451745 RepID=UPI001896BF3D|nr:protein shisa-5 [Nematolebias whitei]